MRVCVPVQDPSAVPRRFLLLPFARNDLSKIPTQMLFGALRVADISLGRAGQPATGTLVVSLRQIGGGIGGPDEFATPDRDLVIPVSYGRA